MHANWVDLILLVILGLSVLLGILKGLIRQVITVLSVVVGLIIAVDYYPGVSNYLSGWIANKNLSDFMAFIIIFFAVLIMGGILALFFSKLMKGPLKLVNIVLGGGLGLLSGLLLCGVIVFAMLVFPFKPDPLKKSFLAPYCLRVTKAVIYLIPDDLKDKFKEAYTDIVKKGKEDDS